MKSNRRDASSEQMTPIRKANGCFSVATKRLSRSHPKTWASFPNSLQARECPNKRRPLRLRLEPIQSSRRTIQFVEMDDLEEKFLRRKAKRISQAVFPMSEAGHLLGLEKQPV